MDRVFRSAQPFGGFQPSVQSRGFKPRGLWYSCGSAWDDWCRAEMPEWIEEAPYVHRLRIDPSRMAFLQSVDDLARFTEKYAVGDEIDWRSVAKRYDGIEICPYQPGFRKVTWYHSWDVASGCIWGLGAFRGADLIEACDTAPSGALSSMAASRVGAVALGSALASAAIARLILSRR